MLLGHLFLMDISHFKTSNVTWLSSPPSLQTARWKVTSKEALQRISEYSEAAITIRGTYFPPGKEPKEGERKIYLAIESTYCCIRIDIAG